MAEFCTCGAELPPDARFCHKCGKPQREEPTLPAEEAPAAAEPSPALPAARPEIGLRNGLAVRVALLSGSLAFLTSSLPFPPALRVLFLLGAGVLAAYIYRRRSGFPLEVRGGMKMGWITGLFCFVIFTVLFAASFAALAVVARDGGMTAYMRDNLATMGMSEENIRQAMEVLENPVQMVWMLIWLFLTSTAIPALGGALGAKLLNRS